MAVEAAVADMAVDGERGKRRRHRAPRGSFAVAVLVVAVGCAGVVALVNERPEGQSAAEPQPSWERVRQPDFGPASPVASVNDVIPPANGVPLWLATGALWQAAGGRRSPVVWTSSDGIRWERTVLPAPLTASAFPHAAARRQGRTVVVGEIERAPGDKQTAIWTSSGGAWDEVRIEPGPSTPPASSHRTWSVAAGEPGFVAIGRYGKRDEGPPILLFSPDGVTWHHGAPAPPAGLDATATLLDVAVAERGLVAVGTVASGSDVDAAAWYSTDGITWQRAAVTAPGGSGPSEQRLGTVVATSAGFVAAGSDARSGRRQAMVWTSFDGQAWERLQPDPGLEQAPDRISTAGVSIARLAGSGPLVAVSSGVLQIWRSADGRRWARDELPATLRESGVGPVAFDGTTALAFTGGVTSPAVWRSPAPGRWERSSLDATVFSGPTKTLQPTALLQTPDRLVLFASEFDPNDGGGESSAVVWTSPDGRSWQRFPDATGVFRHATVSGATQWPGGLVAVGQVRDGLKTSAMAWTSSDGGASWSRVRSDQPGFTGDAQHVMLDVAAGGPGLVAVGFSFARGVELDAQAWRSHDGREWEEITSQPAWGGAHDQGFITTCAVPAGVLATGYFTNGPEQDGWAFYSNDGLSWSRAVAPGGVAFSGPGRQSVSRCVATGSGIIAVGNVSNGVDSDVARWMSADGQTWKSLDASPALSGPGDQVVVALAAAGSRVVGVGWRDGDLGVWLSDDGGLTWRVFPGSERFLDEFGGQTAVDVAIVGERVVVVGRDDLAIALWIGDLPPR